MKSFCIKINNNSIIKYLLDRFSLLELDNLYLSSSSFKIYDNVIVHYSGNDIKLFEDYVCIILTDTILKFYEPLVLRKELNNDFFYFSCLEKDRILELCDSENSIESEFFKNKYFAVYNALYKYLKEHHSIVLNGFFNFRLQEYKKCLDYVLNTCINRYLIEREYFEFINILRLYINSNISKVSNINLVYYNNKAILLDDNKQVIDSKSSEALNAKFLSDITFSDNDYVLNYLLNTLPAHLTIHFPINRMEDEFINTLKLIFEDRITICNNCDICSLYKYIYSDIKT